MNTRFESDISSINTKFQYERDSFSSVKSSLIDSYEFKIKQMRESYQTEKNELIEILQQQ